MLRDQQCAFGQLEIAILALFPTEPAVVVLDASEATSAIGIKMFVQVRRGNCLDSEEKVHNARDTDALQCHVLVFVELLGDPLRTAITATTDHVPELLILQNGEVLL